MKYRRLTRALHWPPGRRLFPYRESLAGRQREQALGLLEEVWCLPPWLTCVGRHRLWACIEYFNGAHRIIN